jgi:hypothetical protein
MQMDAVEERLAKLLRDNARFYPLLTQSPLFVVVAVVAVVAALAAFLRLVTIPHLINPRRSFPSQSRQTSRLNKLNQLYKTITTMMRT